MNDELVYLLALQRTLPFNPLAQKTALEAAGGAKALLEARNDIDDLCPKMHPRTRASLRGIDAHLARAEQELEFIDQHHIQAISIHDELYPARLRDLSDPPLVIFHLGNTPLQSPHILSVVGSRHSTDYGKTFCERFLRELQALCPDTLVVSGLAYGIDIAAHRGALDCGLPTLGVLAHGLDQIYPRPHTETAKQMIHQGGLLTEYQSGAKADKANFVARNRIVAALADATLVIESKEHGGSLITTRIAGELGRRVFAMPGRPTDELSMGCNELLHAGAATPLLTAEQFVQDMGWVTQAARAEHAQLSLFPELTPEQAKVAEALRSSDSGLTINELVGQTDLSASALSALLFDLELLGVARLVGGSRYMVI